MERGQASWMADGSRGQLLDLGHAAEIKKKKKKERVRQEKNSQRRNFMTFTSHQ